MNELNYATPEASKRLEDAGIILETDVYHKVGVYGSMPSMLCTKTEYEIDSDPYHPDSDPDVLNGVAVYLPAPSMAEVWRELPNWIEGEMKLSLAKFGDGSVAGYGDTDAIVFNTNPTDALIDLLIWVKEYKQ